MNKLTFFGLVRNFQLIAVTSIALLVISCSSDSSWDFSSDYFKIRIDNKGYITSMKNITVEPNREWSQPDKPSPLLCLYDSREEVYYEPYKASYQKSSNTISLKYSNGSEAQIRLIPQKKYFKLTLKSVTPRNEVDACKREVTMY